MQTLYYGHQCTDGCTHITLSDKPKQTSYYQSWQASLQQVIEDLHSGELQPEDLNEDLFLHYLTTLETAAGKGLKVNLGAISNDDPDAEAYKAMRESIYQFSGAKTYRQLADINSLLYTDKGERVSKDVFKANATKYYRDAQIIDDRYYEWLNVEYDQAQATGDMARQWKSYERNKDVANLQYVTVGDDRVRPAHALLNGIIRPKTDPFWKTNFPPNGWLCRCDAVETNDPVTAGDINFKADPGFDFNPGITNKIFGDSPYYPKSKKMKALVVSRASELANKNKDA